MIDPHYAYQAPENERKARLLLKQYQNDPTFLKWQASRQFHENIEPYIDAPMEGAPGFVYGDMSWIHTIYEDDGQGGFVEWYEVIIGNVIQVYGNLYDAEAYLWHWHAKDNSHDNYDDLSHLSTAEEVK